MKPRKVTPAKLARMAEVAELRAKIPTYKELGKELELAPLYVAQLVSEIIRAKHKHLMKEIDVSGAKIKHPEDSSCV